MNYIADRLMDIEKTAEGIVEHAEEEKHDIEKYYQEKRDAFDQEIRTATTETIEEIRENFTKDMDEKLAAQKEATRRQIDFLTEDYRSNKEKYIKELIDRITEV